VHPILLRLLLISVYRTISTYAKDSRQDTVESISRPIAVLLQGGLQEQLTVKTVPFNDMQGLGFRFFYLALLVSCSSAIQHGFVKSSTPKAAPNAMAGRRALISGGAWLAVAQVTNADETKSWMKAFDRSNSEPEEEVPLDKRGVCATGFFVNYNPGMCTKIGDITQVRYKSNIAPISPCSFNNYSCAELCCSCIFQRAKSTDLSDSELTATSSLEAKLRARQLKAESK